MRRIAAAIISAAAIAITGLFPVAAAENSPVKSPGPSHGIAMHGDLKYAKGFSHFNYVNPKAAKGGTVRLNAIGTYDSFNSFIIKGNPAAGLGFIYDNLMFGSADEAFSQYGQLAESVETPEDRSWVTFTLRANARWNDGMPVTVADVIWSFKTLTTKGTPFYRFYYGNVADAHPGEKPSHMWKSESPSAG